MKEYKEFQFGWMIFIPIISAQVLLAFLYINKLGTRPLDTTSFIAVSTILILALLLSYRMTINVEDKFLTISFGVGLIKKRIEMKRIKSVSAINSPWYFGWGIRLIPHGILYNVSGQNGIELQFNDSNRVIRIGTKNSTQLNQEITKRLPPH